MLVTLPKGMHRRYHTYVDQRVRQLVRGCPSIWDPRGAPYWEKWMEDNAGAIDQIVDAMIVATREFEQTHKIKGLVEAIQAALP